MSVQLPGDPDHVNRYTCVTCGELVFALVWDTGATIDGRAVEDFEIATTTAPTETGRINRELVDVEPRICANCEAASK